MLRQKHKEDIWINLDFDMSFFTKRSQTHTVDLTRSAAAGSHHTGQQWIITLQMWQYAICRDHHSLPRSMIYEGKFLHSMCAGICTSEEKKERKNHFNSGCQLGFFIPKCTFSKKNPAITCKSNQRVIRMDGGVHGLLKVSSHGRVFAASSLHRWDLLVPFGIVQKHHGMDLDECIFQNKSLLAVDSPGFGERPSS